MGTWQVWGLAVGLAALAGVAQSAVIGGHAKPWAGGVVPYHFDPVILQRAGATGIGCDGWGRWAAKTQAFKACKAMDAWHRASGVRFVHDPKRALGSLYIRDDTATTATVGRLPAGNRVNIETGASYGGVLHEFGHVLGLVHEHQRPDRDDYLNLAPFLQDHLKTCGVVTAVCRDVRLAFPKIRRAGLSSDYDPCSLMHYLSNQAPRHREDPRWSRIFTLTDKGKAALKSCLPQFKALPERCRKVGQKCAISQQDAVIVRRFNKA